MSEEAKACAGRAAADLVEPGMKVGLGTGSTARHAILRLGERIAREGLTVAGIPTSLAAERLARECGIPLTSFAETVRLDLTIDGADEIDPAGNLTKGGGGALLREKVVAAASERLIVVAEPEKLVERLGRSFPLPVEIVPFAHHPVQRALRALGAEGRLRQRDGAPYRTDNGNWILDLSFGEGISDPAALEAAIDRIPGVLESGLFVAMARVLVLGRAGSAEIRQL